jgi:predicted NUDIX family NTP pyrophosphohydrolase
MLYVELANVTGDWMWHSGRIDNMPEVRLGWFDKLMLEKANDKLGNIGGGGWLIAWCD